jgi:hypothetical protein
MAVMAMARAMEQVAVLLWIRNQELRRQLSEFLGASGYACVDFNGPDKPPECGLLLAEVGLEEAVILARNTPEDRPDLRLLFVCGEPAYVGRALLTDPRVAFIEKPFAWCELRRAILELLAPAPGECAPPSAAVA